MKFSDILSFPVIFAMWVAKVRSSLSSTPKYRWCLTSARATSIIVYWCCSGYLFLVTLNTEHLVGLKLICHLSDHLTMVSKSLCRLIASFSVSVLLYKRQSSAKSLSDEVILSPNIIDVNKEK